MFYANSELNVANVKIPWRIHWVKHDDHERTSSDKKLSKADANFNPFDVINHSNRFITHQAQP
jgi:hypothetical protein